MSKRNFVLNQKFYKKDNEIVLQNFKGSALTFGCMHLGKEDKQAYQLIRSWLSSDYDLVIVGGDLFDAEHFRLKNKETGITNKHSQSFMIDAVEKDKVLAEKFRNDFINANPNTIFAIIRGNHDVRYEKFAEHNPLFRSELSYENFKKNWIYGDNVIHINDYNDGEILRVGDAKFFHGRYWGQNHLKKHYEAYGANSFYWHTHAFEVLSTKRHGNKSAPVVATLGCLEKLVPEWMAGSPHNWVHCYQTFDFTATGTFDWSNTMIENEKGYY